ncbi:SoxY-related AACIE arm protein [Prosthecomicrobium sp. N25]|uniref:SoxY-related AACIE arm protein n=1 Tax=Prosthecomicrobium sp. N25 TaxID=3129254 RepID=UPI003078A4F6
MTDATRLSPTRRSLVLLGAGGLAWLTVRPALATPDTMAAGIADFTRGVAPIPGRVALEIPPLVENGNSVPLTIRVDSPMTEADHVATIAVFNEKNPQPFVARFHLGPWSGRAEVGTRIRLGDSQKIVAVAALSDGTFWSGAADLVVTLPACVEN